MNSATCNRCSDRSPSRTSPPAREHAQPGPRTSVRWRPTWQRAIPRRRSGGPLRSSRSRPLGNLPSGARPRPGLQGRPPGQGQGRELCNGSCGAWQDTPSGGPRARPSWPVAGTADAQGSHHLGRTAPLRLIQAPGLQFRPYALSVARRVNVSVDQDQGTGSGAGRPRRPAPAAGSGC